MQNQQLHAHNNNKKMHFAGRNHEGTHHSTRLAPQTPPPPQTPTLAPESAPHRTALCCHLCTTHTAIPYSPPTSPSLPCLAILIVHKALSPSLKDPPTPPHLPTTRLPISLCFIPHLLMCEVPAHLGGYQHPPPPSPLCPTHSLYPIPHFVVEPPAHPPPPQRVLTHRNSSSRNPCDKHNPT